MTAGMTKEEMMQLARAAANRHGLDGALVCAIVEQESAWNPWAIRYEPAFFSKYVVPLYTNHKVTATEAYARGFSWGLMQVMGQVARETGFDEKFLAELCDPAMGLEMGCAVFAKKLHLAHGDTGAGLLRWNGGANADYPAQVLARVPKYNAEGQRNAALVQEAAAAEN